MKTFTFNFNVLIVSTDITVGKLFAEIISGECSKKCLNMSWINCTVSLNSDSTGSFYTGSIVTGTLLLECEQEQKIEKIDFEVTGISKAQWTRPMPTIPYIKIYSEKKKVLSTKMCNILSDVIADNKMPAGIYTHPFHFALPDDLPSSFESSIAKVFYFIKIKSKPDKKLRKIVPFTVFGNVNINHLEEMLRPSTHEFHKKFRSSGSLSMTVKTYKGFAPKQKVPFEITISNEKKVAIQKINIILLQKLRYEVQSGYAEEEKKICKISHKQLTSSPVETCVFDMEIPQVIPSSIHLTETMVHISYIFRVEVIFPFHFTLQGDVPVTVATLPVTHYNF